MVAVAIAVAFGDVRTATFTDGPRAIAHAAFVVRSDAIVLRIAEVIPVDVFTRADFGKQNLVGAQFGDGEAERQAVVDNAGRWVGGNHLKPQRSGENARGGELPNQDAEVLIRDHIGGGREGEPGASHHA